MVSPLLDSRAEICQTFVVVFGKFKTSKSHSEINWPLKKFLELNGIPKDFRPKRTSSPMDLNRGIIPSPSPDSDSSLEIVENFFPMDSMSSKEVTN